MPNASPQRLTALWIGLFAAGFLSAQPAGAADPIDWRRPPLPWEQFLDPTSAPEPTAPTTGPRDRVQLFSFQPGYLTQPVGLDQDEPLDPSQGNDPGPDWLQLSLGNDNPYFDIRRPGDPGGVGYFRLFSQVQVFDLGRTGCTVGLQAVTPAGLAYDGLANGPTVMMPGLGVYHALEDGTAIQCFVGKNVQVDSGINGLGGSALGRCYRCGMALQRRLLAADVDGQRAVYFYCEALARYRFDTSSTEPASLWQVLPGLHWQMAERMWMSGAVVLPVGPTRYDGNQWQLTCRFQF
jgi:hypothetical protein